MGLGAYSQIDNLKKIAEDNNIEIPRLRGYRLMKDEVPLSKDEIKEILDDCEVEVCKYLCRSKPFWNMYSCEYLFDSHTNHLCRYYLIEDIDEDGYKSYKGIRWDRIHGRKRRVLKYAIKKAREKTLNQLNMWNKYAGKENVLYICSRIGGDNWSNYGGDELSKLPWFLDRVDDYFDDTYCDIYASIK